MTLITGNSVRLCDSALQNNMLYSPITDLSASIVPYHNGAPSFFQSGLDVYLVFIACVLKRCLSPREDTPAVKLVVDEKGLFDVASVVQYHAKVCVS